MTDSCDPKAATPSQFKYLEFLTALYQANRMRDTPVVLESVEQRLLELITVQHFLKKPLTMMQLLTSNDVLYLGASTISRKIEVLQKKGWIHVVADKGDRRVRLVEPTEKTMAYFELVSSLMPK